MKSAKKITSALIIQEAYEANKSTIGVIMGHFFLRYLSLLYKAFDGDLIMPIVLGEIAHHNVVKFYSRQGDCMDVKDRMSDPATHYENLEPSNAYSISEATGIPRETVRRKVKKLVKQGWLIKNSRGDLTIHKTVVEHFTKDFNKVILNELLEATDCIKMVMATEKT